MLRIDSATLKPYLRTKSATEYWVKIELAPKISISSQKLTYRKPDQQSRVELATKQSQVNLIWHELGLILPSQLLEINHQSNHSIISDFFLE